ncbi:MAG: hypothetical protein JSR82_05235, partial [Verrucomicrobia bacterium]|nr:hypothetical protein [Verrucomicrobiota bacterium]
MAAAAPPPSSLPGVLAELAARLGDELRLPPRSVASFPRVDAAALPFLLALLGARGRVWFVADGVREAERVHDDLLALLPEAILLPELTLAAGSDGEIDPELAAEQLHAASRIRQAEQALGIVLTRAAWDGGVLGGDAGEELTLRRGQAIGLDEVIARLAAAGFERLPQTAERGQFAVRGGVLDFFAPAQLQPVRLEWFGDEIESIRAFDVHSQASSEELAEVRCTLQAGVSGKREETATLVRPDDVVVALREGVITARRGQVPATEAKAAARELSLLDLAPRADVWWRDDEVGREAGRQRALSQLQYWAREGVHFTIVLSEHEEPARAELLQMIAPLPGPPQVVPGRIASAVLLRGLQRAVLPAALLLGHRQRAQVGTRPNWLARRGAAIRRESSESSQAFEAGDLVVHEEHGIARFRGLGPSPHEPEGPAMLELEFEGGARIYVPLEQSHLVGRYQGLGKQRPSLSRLGEARWASALRSAQTATKNYAATLLRLQAMRETGHGEAFPPDGEWQAAFEASFPYQETPDQLRSIADTKRDMESTRPMDRLICG